MVNFYKKLKFLIHYHSMMKEKSDYYYNPYLPENREGKGEKMSLIRAVLLLCITALLCVGAVTFNEYRKNRFEIIPMKDGVFVFDRQTSASNFCDSGKCIVLSSEFLIPKKVLVAEIPGVVTKTQLQGQTSSTARGNLSQQSAVTPAFNQAQMAGQNQGNNMRQGFSGQQPQQQQNPGEEFQEGGQYDNEQQFSDGQNQGNYNFQN